MSIIVAFVIFLIIFILFIELFTVLFVNTGLPYDKARFQVVSMLTSVGYTTKESEYISSNKRRRKIATWVMILGYVGNVTCVTFLISLIINGKISQILVVIVIIAGLIAAIVKSRKAMLFIDKILVEIIKRNFFGKFYFRYKTILEGKEYSIYTISLQRDNFLIGKTLLESRLMRDYEIQVLMIERNEHEINCPKPNFIFQVKDEITIYGKLKNIEELFLL